MAPSAPGPRVVLLQIRDHRVALEQERQCFATATGLSTGQLSFVNLVETPQLDWVDVKDFDAVLIGGAGHHSATQEYAFSAAARQLVLRLVERQRPVFGSCWGHHLIAQALGGEVIRDAASEEVGTFDIELTAAGREDPLFGSLPGRFAAHAGHHDRVAKLAPSLVELAYSQRCRIQALRVEGSPVYATQFHGEMNEEQMRERLMMYKDRYLAPGVKASDVAQSLRSTPHATRLLRRFLSSTASRGSDRHQIACDLRPGEARPPGGLGSGHIVLQSVGDRLTDLLTWVGSSGQRKTAGPFPGPPRRLSRVC